MAQLAVALGNGVSAIAMASTSTHPRRSCAYRHIDVYAVAGYQSTDQPNDLQGCWPALRAGGNACGLGED